MSTVGDVFDNSASQHKLPKIFVRTFWGFDPGSASIIGFTHEGDRTSFLQEYEPGDLVLIYGAASGFTQRKDVGQILGFLDVEPTPVRDIDRMSPEAIQWRRDTKNEHRWTFAIPVRRAWKCEQPIELKQLTKRTFSETQGRRRGKRGVVLHKDEIAQVMKLRVTPVNVYKEPPIYEGEAPPTLALMEQLFPSHAFPGSWGLIERLDGPHQLYLALFKGAPQLLLKWPTDELVGKDIVKVGISKNPDERRKSLNQCFPPAAQKYGFQWEEYGSSQKIYPDNKAAIEAENKIKKLFENQFKSLGGEFFLGDKTKMQSEFLRHTIDEKKILSASSPTKRT